MSQINWDGFVKQNCDFLCWSIGRNEVKPLCSNWSFMRYLVNVSVHALRIHESHSMSSHEKDHQQWCEAFSDWNELDDSTSIRIRVVILPKSKNTYNKHLAFFFPSLHWDREPLMQEIWRIFFLQIKRGKSGKDTGFWKLYLHYVA